MNQAWVNILPRFIRARLDGRTALQKAMTNTGWLFGDQAVRMGVGLVVGVWVARYLGPVRFGTLSFAFAFVALFSAFSTLGLDRIVVRELVLDPGSADDTLGAVFALKLLGSVFGLALVVAAITLMRPDDALSRWLVAIIAAGAVFRTVETVDFWFQSQVRSKYTVFAKGSVFLLICGAKVVLILAEAPLIAFAWAALGETVVAALALAIAYRVDGRSLLRWRAPLKRAAGLLRDSWPLILSGMAIMIYMKIDQVMLGEMAGDHAVGIYSAAVRLSEAWYFIPVAVTTSIFPSIIEAKKIDEHLYQRHLQRLYSLMTWLAVAIALPVTFLGDAVIGLLFGQGFEGAGTVLSVHIWAGVFVFLGMASTQFLLTENYTRIALYRTTLGAAANVALNLYLIPRYGVNGAAMATLVSYFIATFSLILFSKTRRQSRMMLRSLLLVPALKGRLP